MIGQQHDLLAGGVADDNTAQEVGAALLGIRGREGDELVGDDFLAGRADQRLLDSINGIVLQPGDKEDVLFGPGVKERIVAIPAIHHHDAAFRERELPGDRHIGDFPIGNDGEGGQIAVIVEHEMDLGRTFALLIMCPGKEAGAEFQRGRVQGKQRLFKAEAAFFARSPGLCLLERGVEEPFVDLRGTVFVGISQRAFGGSAGDPEVVELATGETQAITDFRQTSGLGELQVEHGDQLHPAGKAFGTPLAAFLPDQATKGGQRDELQELGE